MDKLQSLLNFPGKQDPEIDINRVYITADTYDKTIYLADLPRQTSYNDISELFEKKIGACNISIKRPLFKDFYYAYVQFQKKEHAEKALSELRYPMIRGAKCRVLPFKSSSKAIAQAAGSGDQAAPSAFQLFVKGFPTTWNHEDLHKTFTKFGKITSAKISIDGGFKSRGYGFVQFETQEAAVEAIKELHDKPISEIPDTPKSDSDAKLVVSEFVPKQDRDGTSKPRCSTNLYVKNFPVKEPEEGKEAVEFADSDLEAIFGKFGEILNVTVMKDADGKSKGFGFVCFKDWKSAQSALEVFNGETKPEGLEKLYVQEFKSKDQRQLEIAKKTYQFKKSMQYLNLVVKNIDETTTEDEFREYFSQFGEIKSMKLNAEQGTGFVSFTDRDAARLAREKVPSILFKNRQLFANFCEPREQRQMAIEEKKDRSAYTRAKREQVKSQNSDVLDLITCLSFFMSQFQPSGAPPPNYGRPRFYNNNHMGQRQQNQHFGGQNQRYQNRRQNYDNGQQMTQQQQQMAVNGRVMQPAPQPYQQPAPVQPMPNPMQPQMTTVNQGYHNEIMQVFMSQEFMTGTEQAKKELVGTAIYKHVSNIVGEQHAPKVTGMIIDLPPAELNQAVMTYDSLQSKVNSALQLLKDSAMQQQPAQTVVA